MAEVLGSISSVLTVANTLHTTIKIARTLYKAQKEFEILQHDLQRFTRLLADIKDNGLDAANEELMPLWLDLERTLEQLNYIIEQKLLAHKPMTNQVRRTSWFRHRAKVNKLKAAFEKSRNDLLTMVSMRNLASSSRLEVALSDTQRDAARLLDASSTLDSKMNFIYQDITKTNQVVTLQNQAILGLIGATQDYRALEEIPSEQSIPNSRLLIGSSGFAHSLGVIDGDSRTKRFGFYGAETGNPVLDSAFLHPASILDMSPNFFPESYTSATMVPKVIIMSFHELESSNFTRKNFYRALFYESARRWCRLDIILDIPRASTYWEITRIANSERPSMNRLAPLSVPGSLLGGFRRILEQFHRVREDTCIRLTIAKDDSVVLAPPHFLEARLSDSSSKVQHIALIQEDRSLVAAIDDLGCRKLSEDMVEQVAPVEFPDRFVARVDRTLAVEVKLWRGTWSSSFLYSIQVFHTMSLRRTQGMVRLIGVVIDQAKQRVKSYLLKYPDTRCEFILERASILSTRRSLSWKIVEDWAKQVTQIVKSIHSGGHVVGTLCYPRPPILVDATNQLYLCRVAPKLFIGVTTFPFYPPEFRHYIKLSGVDLDEAEIPDFTSKGDIYQLGTLLWILAESWASGKSAHLVKASLTHSSRQTSESERTGVDHLPSLSNTIPNYYRSIIHGCRAEDPFDRPSAGDILSMFPHTYANTVPTTKSENIASMDVEAMRDCRLWMIYCDNCSRKISSDESKCDSLFFHCNICHVGDFDMCMECFRGGNHCLDSSHLLLEMVVGEGLTECRRFHSSVGYSGVRRITED